jgi:predicted small lipoprotein YifL
MNARIALLLIALPLALAGCGNKGPLVLPPKPVTVDESTLPPEGAEAPPAEVPADATKPPAEVDEPTTDKPPTGDPATPPPVNDGDG